MKMPDLSVARWKYDKDWVYSITYDEALAELSRFVIPVHLELGIPGHVEAVAGQIGRIRRCGRSSYNGMRHMNARQLRRLVAMGWGVGCHSWSHGAVMDDPERELLRSKELLEGIVGRPVTVYCAPGNHQTNLTEDVLKRLPAYGYLAGMSVVDDLNYADADDLLWLNRTPVHERMWGIFDSSFDPHRRIRQAREEHAWLIDYLHCPLEKAVHDYKDCTCAHHRQRLEAVTGAGGGECWYANPDDVVDYRYMRRHARLEPVKGKSGQYVVRIKGLPGQVVRRELTFVLRSCAAPEALSVTVGGRAAALAPGRAGVASFTATVRNGVKIHVAPAGLSRR